MIRRESGFTLIEVMASMLIFSIVTLGTLPLLLSSIRGATQSRASTVAKNLGSDAMERVRGLPYHVSFSTQASRVDVLDMYLPCDEAAGCGFPGQSYADGVFTTFCDAASTNVACPKELPGQYTMTFDADFVTPSSAAPETYTTEIPPATYDWDSVGNDRPPTPLVRMVITVNWTLGGLDRSFELSSLVGDRKFGGTRVSGEARVDYGVRVVASYVADDASTSVLVATLATADSGIETELISSADQAVEAGSFTLTAEGIDEPSETLQDLAGATSILRAPPDQDPASGESAGSISVTHPELEANPLIAFLNQSLTTNLGVKVTNEVPAARGSSAVGAGSSAGTLQFFVNNQAETGAGSSLLLNVSNAVPLVALRKAGATDGATTSGTTGALGAVDRGVDTTAAVTLGDLRLFPTLYVDDDGEDDDEDETNGYVLRLENFAALANCHAEPSAGSAAASYSGTLTLSADSDWVSNPTGFGTQGNSGSRSLVSYDLATDAGRSALNALGPDDPQNPTGTNPLLFEHPGSDQVIGSASDIYLFRQEHVHTDPNTGEQVVHQHPGYLDGADGLEALATPQTENLEEGTRTRALIDSALAISTAPMNPGVARTAFTVLVGNLSCEAVDKR